MPRHETRGASHFRIDSGDRLLRDAVPFVDHRSHGARAYRLCGGSRGSRPLFRTLVMRGILLEAKHLNMSRKFEDTKEDLSKSLSPGAFGRG